MAGFIWCLLVIVLAQSVSAWFPPMHCQRPPPCTDDYECKKHGPNHYCLGGRCRYCCCDNPSQCRYRRPLGYKKYIVQCDCGWYSYGKCCDCGCPCKDAYGVCNNCTEFTDYTKELAATEYVRENATADDVLLTTNVQDCYDHMFDIGYHYFSFGHNKCTFFLSPMINLPLPIGQFKNNVHYLTVVRKCCIC